MSTPVRMPVLDTGLRGALENTAMDRAWFGAHARGECGPLLRFHRSERSASVGLHQAIDRELRLDHCARRGICRVRRVTGGGALYLDPGQLCFTLVMHCPVAWSGLGLRDLLRLACSGLAAGLAGLGVRAAFKGPNDLEVEGRKIASMFCARDGSSLLFQGVILVDADVRSMLEALRVPTEKLSPDGLATARDRLATLSERIGAVEHDRVRAAVAGGLASFLGFECATGPDPLPAAPGRAALEFETQFALWREWSSPGWIEALWRSPLGSTLRARARLEPDGGHFAEVDFAGDFQVAPATLFDRLEENLRGLPVDLAQLCAEHFVDQHPGDPVGFDPDDVVRLVALLAQKRALMAELGLGLEEANAVMMCSRTPAGAGEMLAGAGAMLVPYCAKPTWCKFRHRDACPDCGLCEVGAAYRLGRDKGLEVVTVTSYEHLRETLARLRGGGMTGFVGMCCSEFFVKRNRAFQESGLSALLMDVSGANCYDLRQEDQAYAGKFQAQALIDDRLLEKVMRFVPSPGPEDQSEA